ncbi:hypothetical protein PanWU01x14_173530 [Parasponia andersonii]|uniref:Uncharacterized protein n=1 Tax=Parasponia andersonii TaxID=3476 RepID=A0A2P5C8T6_PARAD|nr:hypothetical protein PanWU01x14_173530 [Parasponia andersonii]
MSSLSLASAPELEDEAFGCGVLDRAQSEPLWYSGFRVTEIHGVLALVKLWHCRERKRKKRRF